VTATAEAEPLVPEPAAGRVFTGRRRVRLGDVSPRGRMRLDAVARYLQDVADDDIRHAGFVEAKGWVVRRTIVEVGGYPTYLEPLTLRTWCSAIGGRWAERRTILLGEVGGRIDTASLWVHLDPTTMRPLPLPPQFHALYGEAAGGRTVRVRRLHPDRPATEDVTVRRWPLRFSDFDVLGHVNNAAYWAIVEDQLAGRRDLRAPLRVELEHRGAVDVGQHEIEVVVAEEEDRLSGWMRDEDGKLIATNLVISRS
jgi:acyl-ACP thioesterase